MVSRTLEKRDNFKKYATQKLLGQISQTCYFMVDYAPHVISGVTNYVPFQMRNIIFFRAIFEVILSLSIRNNM